jgi:hypothetical protein
MRTAGSRVALVVDRNFGSRIAEISPDMHVWVVESPSNSLVVARLWASTERGFGAGLIEPVITSFDAREDESPEDLCARIVPEIDQHHGEYQRYPAWSEIVVYGTPASARLKASFADIGGAEFEQTSDGFICRP